jgi:hypothetical protein
MGCPPRDCFGKFAAKFSGAQHFGPLVDVYGYEGLGSRAHGLASEIPAKFAGPADGDDRRRLILGGEFQHLPPVPRESFEQVEPIHVGGLIEHEEAELTRGHNIAGPALGSDLLVAGDGDPSALPNFGDPLLVGTVRCEVGVEIRKAGGTDQL